MENINGQEQYGNGPAPETQQESAPERPAWQLKTNRGLLRYIVFGIITLGIYAIVFFTAISTDINLIARRYDGKKTMHFCLLFFLIGPITFGIAWLVWFHKVSNRIGDELTRRGVGYSFSCMDFWLWYVLGSIIIVGPFIYMHKLCVAFNRLAEDYNING